MDESPTARVGRYAGVAAVVVAFAGIVAAVLTDPAFTWTDSALSDLGVATDATALFFNYGLLLGGALALPYAWWYAATAATRAGVAAGVAFAASAVCMAGVGAFPSDTSLHAPVAVGFYLLLTYTLALDASAAVLRGDPRRALAWFWAALGHFSAWILWVAVVAAGYVSGIAVPELAGALLLAAWVFTTVRGRRPRPR